MVSRCRKRAENDFCYTYLPAITGDHSNMNTVVDMADGAVKGYFVMGENPVVGTVHGSLHRKGLRALEWLVVRDFQLTETAEFWRDAPEIRRGEVRPEDIATEVFFFPAAAHTEKDGSFTRNAFCNGITKPSILQETAAANWTSSSNSVNG